MTLLIVYILNSGSYKIRRSLFYNPPMIKDRLNKYYRKMVFKFEDCETSEQTTKEFHKKPLQQNNRHSFLNKFEKFVTFGVKPMLASLKNILWSKMIWQFWYIKHQSVDDYSRLTDEFD